MFQRLHPGAITHEDGILSVTGEMIQHVYISGRRQPIRGTQSSISLARLRDRQLAFFRKDRCLNTPPAAIANECANLFGPISCQDVDFSGASDREVLYPIFKQRLSEDRQVRERDRLGKS